MSDNKAIVTQEVPAVISSIRNMMNDLERRVVVMQQNRKLGKHSKIKELDDLLALASSLKEMMQQIVEICRMEVSVGEKHYVLFIDVLL